MTPEILDWEIKKRWKETCIELLRRKRLDPDVYNAVLSTLANFNLTEAALPVPFQFQELGDDAPEPAMGK